MLLARIAILFSFAVLSVNSQCRDFNSNICRIYTNFCRSNIVIYRNFLRDRCQATCSNYCEDDDPTWTSWSTYSLCTLTCGGGTRTRIRQCIGGSPGNECEGSATDIDNCEEQPCSARWGDWLIDGECSATCGDGVQRERRICLEGNCQGPEERNVLPCNLRRCPLIPVFLWGDWFIDGECSVTCGGGTQRESRICQQGSCQGEEVRFTRSCNEQNCPVQAVWGKWFEDGDCSASCGGGLQTERRVCQQGDCRGAEERNVLACNEQACPQPVGDFSECSADCGSGYQTRELNCGPFCSSLEHRSCRASSDCKCSCSSCSDDRNFRAFCDRTVKRNRRFYCGISTVKTSCKKTCRLCEDACDCDPSRGRWTDWTTCSKTCGGGTRFRFRDCNKRRNCPGSYFQSRACEEQACEAVVTPVWGDWEEGQCSVTCGTGVQVDRRSCVTGICQGPNEREVDCIRGDCPTWSDWSDAGSCSRTCGRGTLDQRRECLYGSGCSGNNRREIACNQGECNTPVWGRWTSDGECDVTCGGGFRDERRECVDGPGCDGNPTRRVRCNEHLCPVWSNSWDLGDCSVSCGGGRRTDTRECLNGDNCQPSSGGSRTVDCNEQDCPVWSNSWDLGDCSVSCGGGRRTDTRECLNGDDCRPTSGGSRTVDCNEQDCPTWSEWTDDGACSTTCGPGMLMQRRECLNGPGCDGDATRQVSCSQGECNNPVWGGWVRDGECDVTCGGGLREERRECIDGPGCDGDSTRRVRCNEQPCPVWSNMWDLGDCSVSCGGGRRTDTRECLNGDNCRPTSGGSRTVDCNEQDCPVWSNSWDLGDCSVSCGGGRRTDTRECLNGPNCLPSNGGTREVDCNEQDCPVWSNSWDLGDCSVSCGGGTRTDTRECLNGDNCQPRSGGSRTVDCNEQDCPVWSNSWDLGDCSVSCGGGRRTDTRECLNGDNCRPSSGGSRTVDCNEQDCPVWSNSWDLGDCSVSCGGGTRTDTRECLNGDNCRPSSGGSRTVDCNEQDCPVWSNSWDLGDCSVSCGGGTRTDTRECLNGDNCPPTSGGSRTVDCNEQECPMWSSSWDLGDCSVSCGGGTRTDTRQCLNGPNCLPSNGGTREVDCNEEDCPGMVDQWGTWGSWSQCSITCGRGAEVRSRSCQGGGTCFGYSTEERSCSHNKVCPCDCPEDDSCTNVYDAFCKANTDDSACGSHPWYAVNCAKACKFCGQCDPCGTWNEWRPWSECSKTCGPGERTRTRTCPSGRTCSGREDETRPCVISDCGPQWTEWNPWSACSEPCGGGQRSRDRECEVSVISECGNPLDIDQTQDCNTLSCAETWRAWSAWTDCSRTCGPGEERRTRACRGNRCEGPPVDTRGCNQGICPVYGRWSACSRSCGRGTQTMQDCPTCTISYRDCQGQSCQGQSCPRASCASPLRNRYSEREFACCDNSGLPSGSCGISANPGRIINGRDAAAKRWPWMVFIKPNADALCGGILITRRLVVTAGHCVSGVNRRGIEVLLGAQDFDDTSPHVQRRGVARYYIHPDYSFPLHDIAIMELDSPGILGGDYVRTLCLPKGETVPDDLTCVAAGWGLTESFTSNIPNVLQEVELRTLPFEVCTQGYADASLSTRRAMNSDSMICAGRISGGVDTCNGDSGGPLMCQRCSTCQWFVAGLTSFGDTNCGAAGKPGVYTRVSNYETYINNVIQEVYNDLSSREKREEEDDLGLASGSYSSCS